MEILAQKNINSQYFSVMEITKSKTDTFRNETS